MVGSSDEVSKHNMKFNVIILEEAEIDIEEAIIWYESAQIDLGNEFFKSIDESISFISINPQCSQEIYKEIRRFVIRKFPYGIYYKVNMLTTEIEIIGVIHFKRNVRILKRRI